MSWPSARWPRVRRPVGAAGARLLHHLRAAVRCGVFLVEMIPARRPLLDPLTRRPKVRRISIPTARGTVVAELYTPASAVPHPGILASFGVNPSGGPDPRVAQMGNALARAGFATLLYWPPTARDLSIEPADVEELVVAYLALLAQPEVDTRASGFAGICVGGALSLLAAADPRIGERVAFVCAYAPYASMRTLAVDIAGGTRSLGAEREAWDVDPLTWLVYVRTVTGWLAPEEAARLRDAFERRITWNGTKTQILHEPAAAVDPKSLSSDGRAALRLLAAGSHDVEAALDALPPAAQGLLAAMSPLRVVQQIAAPLILILHDRFDHVIPVGESRRLSAALAHRKGAVYTELGLRHLKMPTTYSLPRIGRELWRSYRAWYPLFLAAARAPLEGDQRDRGH